MKRPGFRLETKFGVSFDANNLIICWDRGWIVSFICSGVLQRISANEIKEIHFTEEGPTFCNECDGPIPNRG